MSRRKHQKENEERKKKKKKILKESFAKLDTFSVPFQIIT